MRNERIGDYLVSQGLLNEEQLTKVLQAQKESNGAKKFGDVVVELGFMTEVNFTKALAGKLRVQYVELSSQAPPSPSIVHLILDATPEIGEVPST